MSENSGVGLHKLHCISILPLSMILIFYFGTVPTVCYFRTVPTVWHFLFFIIWLLLVLEMIEDKWIEECFLNLPGGATCGGCWYCWYSAVGHCCACWCWGHCCVGHCWVCCHCAACCCKSVNFFCSSVDIGFNSC